MRSLAIIAAGSCAVGSACVFLYKRSKARKRRVERLEPRSSDCGPELGSTALPESTEFNPEVERLQPHSSDCGAERGWTVLPASTEFLDKLPEKSPLRAFFAHAVTRRILNAMPVYLILIPISVYAPRAGPARSVSRAAVLASLRRSRRHSRPPFAASIAQEGVSGPVQFADSGFGRGRHSR